MASAPGTANTIRAAVLEGLRHGSQGVAHEMLLARERHWCFRLQDIVVPAAFLWHGQRDPVVPLAVARQYEAIPGCTATYFPGETHTTIIVNRFAAALEALAVAAHGRELQPEPGAAAAAAVAAHGRQLQPESEVAAAVAAHGRQLQPESGAAAAVAARRRQLQPEPGGAAVAAAVSGSHGWQPAQSPAAAAAATAAISSRGCQVVQLKSKPATAAAIMGSNVCQQVGMPEAVAAAAVLPAGAAAMELPCGHRDQQRWTAAATTDNSSCCSSSPYGCHYAQMPPH